MYNPRVLEEITTLQAYGHQVEATEAEGWVNVVFHDYSLPSHFNKPATELLVKLPVSYPNGQPDMFWTDADLLLSSGRVPQSAEAIEPALGKSWRRFSWHVQGWNPATCDLFTYLEFINRRLSQEV